MDVFVCSPYAGKIEKNTTAAIAYCQEEIALGNNPFAPHPFYPQIIDEDTDRFVGIELGLERLLKCDEVHVWGGVISPGMKMEIEYAQENGIPIRYMTEAIL